MIFLIAISQRSKLIAIFFYPRNGVIYNLKGRFVPPSFENLHDLGIDKPLVSYYLCSEIEHLRK